MTGLQLNNTAWNDQLYGVGGGQSDPDYSVRLGRVYFDYVQPSMPTFTIGETTSITGALERPGVGRFDERYNAIRDYIQVANGGVTFGTTRDGTPWYNEDRDTESMLMPLLVAREDFYLREYWVVMVGGSDETAQVFSGANVTAEILILARRNEYANRSEVRDKFER